MMTEAGTTHGKVLGVVLAGGQARRMGGGDKCLKELSGRPLLAHVIDWAHPQVDHLILNANGDARRFTAFGLEVVPDVVEGFAGPLAGILTALEWAQTNLTDAQWVASFAADTPFLPNDLVARFKTKVTAEGGELACAASNGRSHPVFGFWPVRLASDLRRALVDEDMRKIDLWTARYRCVTVDFEAGAIDPFFNVNRPEDLIEAERIVQQAVPALSV